MQLNLELFILCGEQLEQQLFAKLSQVCPDFSFHQYRALHLPHFLNEVHRFLDERLSCPLEVAVVPKT
jgi:hypothetical protein